MVTDRGRTPSRATGPRFTQRLRTRGNGHTRRRTAAAINRRREGGNGMRTWRPVRPGRRYTSRERRPWVDGCPSRIEVSMPPFGIAAGGRRSPICTILWITLLHNYPQCTIVDICGFVHIFVDNPVVCPPVIPTLSPSYPHPFPQMWKTTSMSFHIPPSVPSTSPTSTPDAAERHPHNSPHVTAPPRRTPRSLRPWRRRSTVTPAHRHTGPQPHRSTVTPAHRRISPPPHQPTATPAHRRPTRRRHPTPRRHRPSPCHRSPHRQPHVAANRHAPSSPAPARRLHRPHVAANRHRKGRGPVHRDRGLLNERSSAT